MKTRTSSPDHDRSPGHGHGGRSCRDLVAAISDYIDGELTPGRCRSLEAHLEECPCCERFAGSLRRAVAVCRDAGRTTLPPAVRRRARARIASLLDRLPPSEAPGRRTRAGASGAAKAARASAGAGARVTAKV